MKGITYRTGDRVRVRRFSDRLLGWQGRPGRIAASAGVGDHSGRQLWYVQLDRSPEKIGTFFDYELTA